MFLSTDEDIQWLFDTHLNRIARPEWVRFVILHGNEDCPSKVELYDVEEPNFDSKPVFTIVFWE
jgi:hypothetical protein